MNRRLLAPAAVSAALHLVLLFGVRPTVVRARSAVTEAPQSRRLMEMPREFEFNYEVPGEQYATDPDLLERRDAPAHLVPAANYGEVLPSARLGYETPCALRDFNLGLLRPVVPEPSYPGPAALCRLGDLDRVPRVLFQATPVACYQTLPNARSGQVLVEFTVDETGAVRDPRVVESIGTAFSEAALAAVSRWRFEPGVRGGRIVSFRMAVPFVFEAGDSP